MDIYNANHICNHSDGEGRYSFRKQPPIGIDAINKFGNALAEMIGCELEMAADSDGVAEIAKGWASDVDKHAAWRDTGMKVVEDIKTEFTGVFVSEYRKLMGRVSSCSVHAQEMLTAANPAGLHFFADTQRAIRPLETRSYRSQAGRLCQHLRPHASAHVEPPSRLFPNVPVAIAVHEHLFGAL